MQRCCQRTRIDFRPSWQMGKSRYAGCYAYKYGKYAGWAYFNTADGDMTTKLTLPKYRLNCPTAGKICTCCTMGTQAQPWKIIFHFLSHQASYMVVLKQIFVAAVSIFHLMPQTTMYEAEWLRKCLVNTVIDIVVLIEIILHNQKICTVVSNNSTWKTFCSFSQPFGFKHGCLGYQIRAAL